MASEERQREINTESARSLKQDISIAEIQEWRRAHEDIHSIYGERQRVLEKEMKGLRTMQITIAGMVMAALFGVIANLIFVIAS